MWFWGIVVLSKFTIVIILVDIWLTAISFTYSVLIYRVSEIPVMPAGSVFFYIYIKLP